MRWSVLAASVLLLSPQTSFSQAEVTNVGIDASLGFVLEGKFVALRTSEARSGATDLNGDGDANDFVLHLYDTESDTLTNTGLEASGPLNVVGNVVAWAVFESRQGGADLNGDGDASDFVVHLADMATGTVMNLSVAATTYAIAGDLVAILVLENSQGMSDLNGDGDANDAVLHLADVATGTVTNVGVDAAGGFVIDGGRVVFGVREANEGNTDLNGDGDASDTVLHVVESGVTTNLGRASDFMKFQLEGDLLAFIVGESADGRRDLNGDSDTRDGVMHVHDFATGTTTNLGLAVDGSTDFMLNGGLLGMSVSEQSQGVDLNADADAFDDVIHYFDGSGVTNLSFAIEGLDVGEDGHIAFGVRESRQGVVDLNGDGDTSDLVLHLFDRTTGTTQNLLTDATLGFKLDGDMLLGFGASEASQGGTDGNGDGDSTDFTLYVFDISTNNLISLQVDPSGGFQSFQLAGKFVSFGVQEFAQGSTDLNGDTDFDDIVLHYFDVRTGVTTNLMLDVTLGHQIRDGKIAFVVTESRQGMTDLNGDGDALDIVLHVAHLATPVSPHDRIEALISHVKSLNLNRGIERSSVVILRLAQRALANDKPCLAIKFLRVFGRFGHLRAGRRIDEDDARALIGEAGDIVDALLAEHPECGRHHHSHHETKHARDDRRHHGHDRHHGKGRGHRHHR